MKTKQTQDYFHGGASELAFWSFRYFLGRMTITTCDFAERLARAWPTLNDKDRELIRRELDKAFAEDDEARADRDEKLAAAKTEEERLNARMCYMPLGHDCDREAWEKVRRAYQNDTGE